MGLPRSSLVKPESTAATPLGPCSGVREIEVATTTPQIESPFAPPSVVPAATGAAATEAAPEASPAVDEAPSTHDLLERAARLGPARPTFASIVLPNDPILAEKMQPHAAARRARFQKLVKATLGGCVAVCVAALVATALSGGEAAAAPEEASFRRTAPATAVVTVEKLDGLTRAKAVRHRAAAAHPRAKAKSSKRR